MIDCAHFSICSGCKVQSIPPLFKDVKEFLHPLPVPLITERMTSWRTRAKLAVRGTSDNPLIGLFKEGTHQVIPIPDCPLHHPRINEIVEEIRQQMIVYKIAPYCEKTKQGQLRYLQLLVSRMTQEVQLTLVLNSPELPQSFLDSLSTDSIWLNFQSQPTNTILGDQWHLCKGKRYLQEKIGKLDFFFHPACFSQAHLYLFEKMLLSIESHLLPHKRVVEFYGGIGTIGHSIAHCSRHLIVSEMNPYARECFELTKPQGPIEFQEGAAESLVHLLRDTDVAIVDPPRKGLSSAFSNALLSAEHLQQLIYVSCNFSTFKRDCQRLIDAGWQVEKAEAYLFFPGSDQVETLAFFRRLTH